MPQPLLYLSAFFERHRSDYYRLLLAVSQRGEWLEWITFFLRGVEEQSKDAVDRAKKLLDLWQQYRQQFQSARSSSLLLRLVDELIANPVLTVGRAAALLNITPRAARMNVEKLVKAGIIREISGKQRYQLFIAPEIIRVLESSSG